MRRGLSVLIRIRGIRNACESKIRSLVRDEAEISIDAVCTLS